jgi:hypothetical protein
LLSGKSKSLFIKNAGMFLSALIILLISLTVVSCSDKEKPADKENEKQGMDSPVYVKTQAKTVLGNGVKFAYSGAFNADTNKSIAAGTEIENKDVWGIKFHLLKKSGDEFTKGFETGLLEGSFNKCLVEKIKFPSISHELIYYNSKDYFLGSGGGEIFAYLVDFKGRQCYSAHLFSDAGKPVSLYLSPNIKDSNIKNFFISNFKRDYPALNIVSKDVDLKY